MNEKKCSWHHKSVTATSTILQNSRLRDNNIFYLYKPVRFVAVPCFRRMVAGLSSRRHGISPKPFHMETVADNGSFPPSIIPPVFHTDSHVHPSINDAMYIYQLTASLKSTFKIFVVNISYSSSSLRVSVLVFHFQANICRNSS